MLMYFFSTSSVDFPASAFPVDESAAPFVLCLLLPPTLQFKLNSASPPASSPYSRGRSFFLILTIQNHFA